MAKDTNLKIQEVEKMPSRINTKKSSLRKIIIKLLSVRVAEEGTHEAKVVKDYTFISLSGY